VTRKRLPKCRTDGDCGDAQRAGLSRQVPSARSRRVGPRHGGPAREAGPARAARVGKGRVPDVVRNAARRTVISIAAAGLLLSRRDGAL